MAADGTSIKNDIDNDLANKGYRGIRITTIITTLKKLVDWVSGAVANNVSTWLRSSDNLPGGANNEAIYRTGSTSFSGGVYAKVKDDAATMALSTFGDAGFQVVAKTAGKPAMLEFHVPGLSINQIGIDADGIFKFKSWIDGKLYPIVLSGLSPTLAFPNVAANKKINLINSTNDNQFFGFGSDGQILRYQIVGQAGSHVFFAGASPVTSNELVRITGTGNVGIGNPNPISKLDILIAPGTRGLKISDGSQNESHLPFEDGKNYLRSTTIMADTAPADKVGIGTTAPTSKVHIKGATGYQQFRLEASYVPTGPTDPNGTFGTICWGEDYIYWKTSENPHRWRRAASSGW